MAKVVAMPAPIKASLEDFFNYPIDACGCCSVFTLAEVFASPRARGGCPEWDAKRRRAVDMLDELHRFSTGQGMRK